MARRYLLLFALPGLLSGCICLDADGVGLVALPCCTHIGVTQQANINTGEAPWWLTAPDAAPQPATVISPPDPAWWPLPPASWIGPPTTPSDEDEGNYVYELRFFIQPCITRSHVTISGEYLADNSAQLFLDSSATPFSSSVGTTNFGFLQGSRTQFNITLPPGSSGTHVLKAVVYNEGGPTGFIAWAAIRETCSAASSTPQ